MRREQVYKICLNHALTKDITYTAKDDKTWLFGANDFSEGELALQSFCLRFANMEIASQFKEAIDKSLNANYVPTKTNEDDDVIFVKEIESSSEDKEKAKALMLPENFYTYLNKEPCQGCRGCSDEDAAASNLSPNKHKVQGGDNFNESVYKTPSNINKSVDTSIFRTPLEVNAPNTDNEKENKKQSSNDFIKKEKQTGLLSNNIFRNIFAQNKYEVTQENDTATGTIVSQTSANTKTSILAPPKLSVTAGETSSGPKSIFSSKNENSVIKNIFGNAPMAASTDKSKFTFSNFPKINNNEKPEIKSIFGDNQQTSGNIFNAGGSIFGSMAILGENKPVSGLFGSALSNEQSSTVNNDKILFGNNQAQSGASSDSDSKIQGTEGNSDISKTKENIIINFNSTNKTESDDTDVKSKVENNYFTSLLQSGPGFNIASKLYL